MTKVRDPLLNVRVPHELRAMIERAVKVSGCASLSDWVRQVLEGAANQELARHQRATMAPRPPDVLVGTQGPSGRRLGAQPIGAILPPRCVHPTTARSTTAESEYCRLCGTVTRWLR